MGLVGVRIRIAKKENYIPEFEFKTVKKEIHQPKKIEVEEEEKETIVIEEIPEDPTKPRTESELIEKEEEHIKAVETYEEIEEELK